MIFWCFRAYKMEKWVNAEFLWKYTIIVCESSTRGWNLNNEITFLALVLTEFVKEFYLCKTSKWARSKLYTLSLRNNLVIQMVFSITIFCFFCHYCATYYYSLLVIYSIFEYQSCLFLVSNLCFRSPSK